jgi:sulfite reductase (NADPH) hemoprotein beta-component
MNPTNSEEIDRFEEALKGYFNLQIDAERFTAIRLQQGVYGQRQEGVNMLRVKIPGGSINPAQLDAIADVVDAHSQLDTAHVTTRQDIQVHSVPLEQTSRALRILDAANLTTREACGNTVRNMTGCPMAGVCPKEHVDVSTHLEGAVMHFLRNPLSQQMPRKFKISFSGCESDCAQSMIHDLGITAVHEEGKFGFRVSAGGGLGHKPREAIVVEPFIEEKDLLIVMEALVSLHNRYSDRTKRAKSRIKFLVERFGQEGFIAKYREELEITRSALAEHPYPQGVWKKGEAGLPCGQGAPRTVVEQKQEGLCVFPIALPLGHISSIQLRGLSAIANHYDLRDLRTTQDQNLMILNVPKAVVPDLRSALSAIGLNLPAQGDNVTACPGTSTCRLGITSSMIAATKLDGGKGDLRIRVSGCHNGCAQPETGDIGIYGEGRRLHGKLIPHYQLYLGGDGKGDGGLAIKGPSVPAARIEEAIARLKRAHDGKGTFYSWVRSQEKNFIAELLHDLVEVKPEEILSVLHDHGESREFKVLQLGGGECAGASQVRIGSSFFEAAHERRHRDALFMQRKYGEAARCAESILTLIGQGIVHLNNGNSGNTLNEIADSLKVMVPGKLSDLYGDIVNRLLGAESESLSSLFKSVDAWTHDAAEYCLQHDGQLDLSEALPRAA